MTKTTTTSSCSSPFLRRINSFRLFLWLVGSCSMGWFFLLLAFLRQSPTSSSSSSSSLSLSQPQPMVIATTVTTSAMTASNHVLSLLQFMNASAGHVYPKEESFSDCIYLLTAIFENTTTTKTTTISSISSSSSISLLQSLNGYWKHPVSVRRRQLTPNLKLLQDAVQELERDLRMIMAATANAAAAADDKPPSPASRRIWTALQATAQYQSKIPTLTIPTSNNNNNNNNNISHTIVVSTNDNLDFVTTMPRLGMIPIIVNWKPTLPYYIPRLLFLQSDSPGITTTTSQQQQPHQQPAWLGDYSNVLILRNVIPKRCCDIQNDDQRCSTLTIPNAPLIQQVQVVEQQLLNTPWASCSLDQHGNIILQTNNSATTYSSTTVLGGNTYNNNNSNDNNKLVVVVVGVRVPHDDNDPSVVGEPFHTWIRNVQEEFRTDNIVWERNRHEDDHNIILDLTLNWTLFCQPNTLLVKVHPTPFLDPFTLSLSSKWMHSLFVPLAPEDIQLDRQGKIQNKSNVLKGVQKAHAIWNDASKRQHMLDAKLCWCGQHMKYKALVGQVLLAWAEYAKLIFNGNYQLWKEDFPNYAKGHFWKRPGGDSWSLPLSVVGGIKGGLRADVHYANQFK